VRCHCERSKIGPVGVFRAISNAKVISGAERKNIGINHLLRIIRTYLGAALSFANKEKTNEISTSTKRFCQV